MSNSKRVAIIGSGPAGLMAAEVLTNNGIGVDIYEAMPSAGRKFLMAGKSGLNISHSEKKDQFLSRYGNDEHIKQLVTQFGADEISSWMTDLGIAPFTGSTGRIFPEMMKSSPLLRAWLKRLGNKGAVLHTKHKWLGWTDDESLIFETPTGQIETKPAASVFALGGASWKRLGSDGAWAEAFGSKGIELSKFQPSNNGFLINWSDRIKSDFAGEPIKSVSVGLGQNLIRGEFVVTQNGVESGAIYTLSANIRNQLNTYGSTTLLVDLLPDTSEAALIEKLSRPRGKNSLSNHIRKATKLSGVKLALIYENVDRSNLQNMSKLAMRIKSLPLSIEGAAPIDEAISTIGGVPWSALDDNLMLPKLPGNFCAGEMIDWDAPTGGYLITACMASGRTAGMGVMNWLNQA